MLRLFFCLERIHRRSVRLRKVENYLHSFVEIRTEPGGNALSTLWKTVHRFRRKCFPQLAVQKGKDCGKGSPPRQMSAPVQNGRQLLQNFDDDFCGKS